MTVFIVKNIHTRITKVYKNIDTVKQLVLDSLIEYNTPQEIIDYTRDTWEKRLFNFGCDDTSYLHIEVTELIED